MKETVDNPKISILDLSALIIVCISFIVSAFSTFSVFVPIDIEKWIATGAGKFVFITSILGVFFFIIKNYFVTFFITLFDLFFLLNEVIIKYDSKAVELGQEIASGDSPGYFRSFVDIFADVANNGSGAFYIFIGLFISFILTTICWSRKVYLDNQNAIPAVFCKKCGNKLIADDTFCEKCGERFSEENTEERKSDFELA